MYFFFSSRRRHTRCGRDWSSDVCSSDLGLMPPRPEAKPREAKMPRRGTLFVGKKGIIVTESGGNNPKIYPTKLAEKYKEPRSEERRVGKECRSRGGTGT